MQKKEIKVNTDDFPSELHYIFENARIYDSSSHPSMTVLYSDNGYYVKIAEKGSLAKEAEMAKQFACNGIGVDVVSVISDTKRENTIRRRKVAFDFKKEFKGHIAFIYRCALSDCILHWTALHILF